MPFWAFVFVGVTTIVNIVYQRPLISPFTAYIQWCFFPLPLTFTSIFSNDSPPETFLSWIFWIQVPSQSAQIANQDHQETLAPSFAPNPARQIYWHVVLSLSLPIIHRVSAGVPSGKAVRRIRGDLMWQTKISNADGFFHFVVRFFMMQGGRLATKSFHQLAMMTWILSLLLRIPGPSNLALFLERNHSCGREVVERQWREQEWRMSLCGWC